jgi:hypothetical protein
VANKKYANCEACGEIERVFLVDSRYLCRLCRRHGWSDFRQVTIDEYLESEAPLFPDEPSSSGEVSTSTTLHLTTPLVDVPSSAPAPEVDASVAFRVVHRATRFIR